MADVPGSTSTSETLGIGTKDGTLEVVGDHDWYRIALTTGQSITVAVNGFFAGSSVDTYLTIRDANGKIIWVNDDVQPGVNSNSSISFTAPATSFYYVDVGAFADAQSGSYRITVSNYSPPPLATYDQLANQLITGDGIARHFNASQGGTITVNLTALTSAGQNLAREALATWTDIIGVNFAEVTTGGHITFDDNESGAFAEYSFTSGGIITSAHVNVDLQWLADYGSSVGGYAFQAYIHEIGHALGLSHAGNYDGEALYPGDALFRNDSWALSVMSYFSQVENTHFAGLGFTENYLATPMIADIIAMSQLYGLSTSTRTGNTTYGFNSNAGRSAYNAAAFPYVAYTIYDSGGIDTLDYSGFSQNQTISLAPESFSNVGGSVGNVSIARGVMIENARGGTGNDSLIGNSADNILEGGVGSDYLAGYDGNDTASYAGAFGGVAIDLSIEGVSQNSVGSGSETLTSIENLTGSSHNDTLTGSGGNNRLDGGAGNDLLTGGDGLDTLVGAGGADNLNGGGGDDLIQGGSEVDTLAGGAGADTFRGTASELSGDLLADFSLGDRIVFTDLNLAGFTFSLNGSTLNYSGGSLTFGAGFVGTLVASAAAGGGVQLALSSDPTIYGTAGDDSLTGTSGNDTVDGLGGNDTLVGLDGNDSLVGNDGNDSLDGGTGADTLAGGIGNDIYIFDGSDLLVENGGAGTDEIRTGIGSYALAAEFENLTGTSGSGQALTGNGLVNTITGGNGNDTLDGAGGADVLQGGLGNDVYIHDGTDTLVEAGGAGIDEVRTSIGSYTLLTNFETLTGTSGSGQALTGNGGVNTITAGSGNDTLDGAGGADVLQGGLGNDVYLYDGTDTLIESAGAGTDEVRTAVASYTLGAEFENLTGTGAGGQALTGNGSGNTLTGGTGNDTLDGAGGADTLQGGLGNDVYIYDGVDTLVEGASAGTDEVRTALAGYTLLGNFENLTGTSGAGQALTGNGAANAITGGTGNDTLDGAGGADTLQGGHGNDLYMYDGSDTLIEGAGAGTDEVRIAAGSYTLQANFENLTGTSGAGQGLTGNSLNNVLTGATGTDTLRGADGHDTLNGGTGADSMEGGAGNDIYYVDNAGDVVVELVGEGSDTIYTARGSGNDMAARQANAYQFAANVETVIGTVDTGQGIVGNSQANVIGAAAGNDYIDGGIGNDSLYGGYGDDHLLGGTENDLLRGDYGFDSMEGGDGNDELRGNFNADTIRGGEGDDSIFAGNGHDQVFGDNGNDTIVGALGHDSLTGGAGLDVFVYQTFQETSAGGQLDKILDFAAGQDKLDLTQLDANVSTAADDAFTFIGAAAYSNVAGQLRAYDSGAGSWLVEGDVDGNGTADFRFEVFTPTSPGTALVSADFFL